MVKLTTLPGFPSYIWNVKSQTVRKDGARGNKEGIRESRQMKGNDDLTVGCRVQCPACGRAGSSADCS